MSIPNLPVNFKDDILAASNVKRKYRQTTNDDSTVSFEDVTNYSQEGSEFGAKEVNQTNTAINNIYDERILDLEELELVTEPGFFVDAQAVKEAHDSLNSKLKILKTKYITVGSFESSNVLYLDADYGKECAKCYVVGTILSIKQTPWSSANLAMFRGCRLDENGRGRVYCVGSFVNGHALGCMTMAVKV